MKNRKPTPLSTEGSFESIVNAGTHERRRQVHRWFTKTLWMIVVLLAVVLLNLVLWLLAVVPTVPSLWITGICSCAVCFLAGRLWEVTKR